MRPRQPISINLTLGVNYESALRKPNLLNDPLTGSHFLVPKLRALFTRLDAQRVSQSNCRGPPLAGLNRPVESLVQSWTTSVSGRDPQVIFASLLLPHNRLGLTKSLALRIALVKNKFYKINFTPDQFYQFNHCTPAQNFSPGRFLHCSQPHHSRLPALGNFLLRRQRRRAQIRTGQKLV